MQVVLLLYLSLTDQELVLLARMEMCFQTKYWKAGVLLYRLEDFGGPAMAI
jgi:hypothetical protein